MPAPPLPPFVHSPPSALSLGPGRVRYGGLGTPLPSRPQPLSEPSRSSSSGACTRCRRPRAHSLAGKSSRSRCWPPLPAASYLLSASSRLSASAAPEEPGLRVYQLREGSLPPSVPGLCSVGSWLSGRLPRSAQCLPHKQETPVAAREGAGAGCISDVCLKAITGSAGSTGEELPPR